MTRPIPSALLRFAVFALIVAWSRGAAAQTPSPEQLEMFRNLSPDQQQAVLQQLGNGGQGGSSSSGSSATPAPERRQPQDEAQRRARAPADETRVPQDGEFKAEDSLLVEITLPERRLVTPANGRGGAGARELATGAQVQLQDRQSGATNGNTAGPNQQYLEPVELEERERSKLEDLVNLIRSRNPYRLDRDGNLNLPGFAPIALSGLNEQQSTQRLSAEPALLKLNVRLIRLPLMRTGTEGLKRFGYSLFDEVPTTFSPVNDVPVPADYVVGPGDELNVQTYGGTQNNQRRLTVSRDGTISFPELGPIRVAGLTFNAARAAIESRVSQQFIGVRASVTMGEVRAIRVFVLGEARLPGSYTVSGLSTVTSALFASGGIKPIGSLRDIQLKRQGAVVRRLDLYDLLIHGNTSDDAKLLPGDVIFVPPVGPTVSVEGEVKRPAIYELRGETKLEELVTIAGGLTPEADSSRANLTRIDDARRRVVLGLDLDNGADRVRPIRNGDLLRVSRLRPQLDSGVMVDGFVHRGGAVAWHDGLRLSDVFGSIDELRPDADPHYILIRRESGADRRISVLSADLNAALATPRGAADVALMPRDRITVFELAPGRERIIKPVIEELRQQSGLARPTEVVRVEGRIKVPGEYPLEPGMRVSDLLRAGGNLDTSAFGSKAELARYNVTDSGARQTELIEVDLAALRSGNAAADLALRPFDYLLIKETPDWGDQEAVTLKGEVRFPGTYPIRRGETLRQLLDRAGGLTSLAFPRGSAFTRLELKEREQKQLDQLGERLQSDLVSLSLAAATANQSGASQSLIAGQQMLGQMRGLKGVGRLVIDLNGLLAAEAGGPKDISLRGGDELVVPRQRQEVTVIGEVNSVTSHLYAKTLSRDDYVALSGGMTRKADDRHIYVVRADGSVVADKSSIFRRSYSTAIQPGDTIVVPLNAERIPRLPFWQAITQIVYNLAVSVAAVNSF